MISKLYQFAAKLYQKNHRKLAMKIIEADLPDHLKDLIKTINPSLGDGTTSKKEKGPGFKPKKPVEERTWKEHNEEVHKQMERGLERDKQKNIKESKRITLHENIAADKPKIAMIQKMLYSILEQPNVPDIKFHDPESGKTWDMSPKPKHRLMMQIRREKQFAAALLGKAIHFGFGPEEKEKSVIDVLEEIKSRKKTSAISYSDDEREKEKGLVDELKEVEQLAPEEMEQIGFGLESALESYITAERDQPSWERTALDGSKVYTLTGNQLNAIEKIYRNVVKREANKVIEKKKPVYNYKKPGEKKQVSLKDIDFDKINKLFEKK